MVELERFPLDTHTREFLGTCGLPESAAPFLDFEGEIVAADHRWVLDETFSRYVVVGSNDSGDPVCIDTATQCAVVYLNHDDAFCRVLINSTVSQMAASLLSYRQLVLETEKRNGEDAYLDGDVPCDEIERLQADLKRIDPNALEPGTFWACELDRLANPGNS